MLVNPIFFVNRSFETKTPTLYRCFGTKTLNLYRCFGTKLSSLYRCFETIAILKEKYFVFSQ
jgi:hypothetical protein